MIQQKASKMELFATITNEETLLTIFAKNSNLDFCRFLNRSLTVL